MGRLLMDLQVTAAFNGSSCFSFLISDDPDLHVVDLDDADRL